MPICLALSAMRCPTISAALMLPPFFNFARNSFSALEAAASTLSPPADVSWA
jgi:hypothetical protein